MKINLDINQQKAVFSNQQKLLVVAAPGSGKTTVIINRVAYLVKELAVEPANIIVITFTRAAAANMKHRYNSLSDGKEAPFFGTFHALFYKILRRHVGDINIISSSEAHGVIRRVLLTYLDELSDEKIKEVMNNISLFKSSGLSIDNFKPDIDKAIFENCLNQYEEYKKQKKLLDFDDLQINCKRLFEENPKILEGYRRLFKYILVDEFQDCDNLQIQILQLLSPGSSLFAVGDEDQCIYSFRGSKPDCMVNFDRYFEGGKKVFLSYNYRSPFNIIDLSKVLIKNNKLRNDKEIKAARNDEKNIEVVYSVNENSQSDAIAEEIEKERSNNSGKYGDNAILYRTNVESRSLIDTFIRKRIPFKLLDREYNFFEHFICKDILAYLRLSLDMKDKNSFCRIINKPFRYISKVNLEKVKNFKYKEDCFDILAGEESIPVFQLKVLKDLKKDIHYLNKMSLRAAVDFIILDLGYIDYIREYSMKYKIELSELEDILDEFREASLQFHTIAAFLAHVEEVEESLKNNSKASEEDSVILSTIHGVKGMEFRNVYIINCVEDCLPHLRSLPKGIEEERRLMYVAVTRAIDNLYLSIPKTIRGKVKEISRFITECSPSVQKKFEFGFKEGERIRHNAFGEGEIKEIKGEEISIQFADGILRKFDGVVLVNNKIIKKLEI